MGVSIIVIWGYSVFEISVIAEITEVFDFGQGDERKRDALAEVGTGTFGTLKNACIRFHEMPAPKM